MQGAPVVPPATKTNELYLDLISESSRACAIFARVHHLPGLELKWLSVKRGEHRTPVLLAANPSGKVPFLVEYDKTAPAPSSATAPAGPAKPSATATPPTIGTGGATAAAAAAAASGKPPLPASAAAAPQPRSAFSGGHAAKPPDAAQQTQPPLLSVTAPTPNAYARSSSAATSKSSPSSSAANNNNNNNSSTSTKSSSSTIVLPTSPIMTDTTSPSTPVTATVAAVPNFSPPKQVPPRPPSADATYASLDSSALAAGLQGVQLNEHAGSGDKGDSMLAADLSTKNGAVLGGQQPHALDTSSGRTSPTSSQPVETRAAASAKSSEFDALLTSLPTRANSTEIPALADLADMAGHDQLADDLAADGGAGVNADITRASSAEQQAGACGADGETGSTAQPIRVVGGDTDSAAQPANDVVGGEPSNSMAEQATFGRAGSGEPFAAGRTGSGEAMGLDAPSGFALDVLNAKGDAPLSATAVTPSASSNAAAQLAGAAASSNVTAPAATPSAQSPSNMAAQPVGTAPSLNVTATTATSSSHVAARPAGTAPSSNVAAIAASTATTAPPSAAAAAAPSTGAATTANSPNSLPVMPTFCVGEACAILTYLALKYNVPDHWYPSDLRACTRVDAALHWQQRTLRYHADKLLAGRVVRASNVGQARYEAGCAEAEKGVTDALGQLERGWLASGVPVVAGVGIAHGSSSVAYTAQTQPFMTGQAVCIADLVCACTVEQLRLLDTVKEKPDFTDIVKPFPKVQAWLERVAFACRPHFNDVHASMRQAVSRAHVMVNQQRQQQQGGTISAASPSAAAASNRDGPAVSGAPTTITAPLDLAASLPVSSSTTSTSNTVTSTALPNTSNKFNTAFGQNLNTSSCSLANTISNVPGPTAPVAVALGGAGTSRRTLSGGFDVLASSINTGSASTTGTTVRRTTAPPPTLAQLQQQQQQHTRQQQQQPLRQAQLLPGTGTERPTEPTGQTGGGVGMGQASGKGGGTSQPLSASSLKSNVNGSGRLPQPPPSASCISSSFGSMSRPTSSVLQQPAAQQPQGHVFHQGVFQSAAMLPQSKAGPGLQVPPPAHTSLVVSSSSSRPAMGSALQPPSASNLASMFQQSGSQPQQRVTNSTRPTPAGSIPDVGQHGAAKGSQPPLNQQTVLGSFSSLIGLL